MNEASKTSAEQTYSDFRKFISSPESGYGLTPSAELAGLMHGLSGQEAALANLSARQAKELGLLTSGTYGQRSTISSASAVLTLSLENRLRRLMVSAGSRVYRLTWKRRATPSGRSIPALRALPIHRATKVSTSVSASTGEPAGWRTPTALSENAARGKGQDPFKRLAQGHTLDLQSQVHLVGWATPKASDGSGGRTTETVGGGNVHLDKQARMAGWPTPTSKFKAGGEYSDPEKALARVLGPHSNDLRDFAQIALPASGWTTPQAHDTVGRSKGQKEKHGTKHGCACLARDADKVESTGSPAETESRGRLRAGHSRWLMRIPPEWASCVPTETPSTLRKRKAS